ncbi:MAG: peptidoglycan-binding protein [Clostridia bacterium]|nr:peptidoglycan-binding protein [Clostridia bacterium]
MIRKLTAWLLALVMVCSTAAALAAYATLEYKSSGESVVSLQKALNALGYSTGGVDGKFGNATEKAVRAFQRDHKLKVDGKAGNATQTLLYNLAGGGNASAQPTATPKPSGSSYFGGNYATMRYGNSGSRVKLLQQALKNLGFGIGKIDGKYGNTTKQIVSGFQAIHGLKVDGVAGAATLKMIESLLSGGSAPAQPTATPKPTATPQPTATPKPSSSYFSGDYSSIRLGYTGSRVTLLQKALKSLGYGIGSVDGKYGSATQKAVTEFQKRYGLTADGIAGAKTLTKLEQVMTGGTAAATPTPTPTPQSTGTYTTLQSGSRGDAVTRLQQALKDLKYDVSVTGTYDSKTVAAVKAFQQRNQLTADGIAGQKTQQKLYAGGCVTGDTQLPSGEINSSISAPSKSQIKLLHWFNDIKPTIKGGQNLTIYDPASGLSWTLRMMSLGRHADSEPLTQQDTNTIFRAFGNQNTWNQKVVYARLPNGTWTVASMHNMPHLSGSIKDNGFDGHLCVHFLRDMS